MSGVKSVSSIVVCATAGIIVGVIAMTGLGAKLSYTLVSISGGNVYIAAVLAAVITIALGCGMPPTPVYVIRHRAGAPSMTQMGWLPSRPTCLSLFFPASALTPPVAITAYTAAAIAKADSNKTGFTAFRRGLWPTSFPLFSCSLRQF